ncbi:triose-phosphate isomerase family protein [Lysinimonas soli]|uniref:Triosephosphate isomerase n=1 Tax=Lysinimonas soli TaxID=1074233 RepID=A0ABW0NNJ3_9MICO
MVSFKMYFTTAQAVAWSRAVGELASTHSAVVDRRVELVVLPSFPALGGVIDALAGTSHSVGAQDLFWEDSGPYTGAVSGRDLRGMGCRYVEIGHAERRELFGDDSHAVRLKVGAAIRNNLIPVLCVGEPEHRGIDAAILWCTEQLESALGWLESTGLSTPLVVAYEPVWAIGGEQAASSAHVVAVASALRAWLSERPAVTSASILYGGSAGLGTLTELGGAVDGVFLGRFAHDPEVFVSILDEAGGQS